jgi:hypothetical protein
VDCQEHFIKNDGNLLYWVFSGQTTLLLENFARPEF